MCRAVRFFCVLSLLLFASAAESRVLSYAPVTNRHAIPAVQFRAARHFLLIESDQEIYADNATNGELVLYDSQRIEEPRVVYSAASSRVIIGAAFREEGSSEAILIVTRSPQGYQYELSADGGTVWRPLAIPSSFYPLPRQSYWIQDRGGPVVHGRDSSIRLGSIGSPFSLALVSAQPTKSEVRMVRADATTTTLAASTTSWLKILGTDRTGERLIVAETSFGYQQGRPLFIVTSGAAGEDIGALGTNESAVEGWITPSGKVILESLYNQSLTLWMYSAQNWTKVRTLQANAILFAVPSSDYSSAWIIDRTPASPTRLLRFKPGVDAAPVEQWSDTKSPEVEALHASASGSSLLVQVHRPRAGVEQRMFVDPAVAIWHSGTPAPAKYDELYLNELFQKGFVHLDVDETEAGGSFVFDSGTEIIIPQVSAGGGGTDVSQEWGIVRSSLQQRLVVPGVARLPGGYGSFWKSDLVLQNHSSEDPTNVNLRYISNAGAPLMLESRIQVTLKPGETIVRRDVLKTLFDLDTGGGALYITPEIGHSVSAIAHTYTESAKGTYGMGLPALDLFAGVGARFPLTFSGAFGGADYRTNMIVTDTASSGAEFEVEAFTAAGTNVKFTSPVAVPQKGQVQLNDLSRSLNLASVEAGALTYSARSGQTVASVVTVDNRTNDPTWFPPDLSGGVVRVIPVIGHVDGANGSKFRSDLYLYNPSASVKLIMLNAKRWTGDLFERSITLTLLPHESKIVRDALMTLFNIDGLARVRTFANDTNDVWGIRVTSRTYTIDEKGGTYGFLMPPLNSFQVASSGDALQIIGVTGGSGARTNLGLVDVTPTNAGSPATRDVVVELMNGDGTQIDRFHVDVPAAGGIQLLDIFRSRGLGDGPDAATIRIAPQGGAIGAYAAVVDNLSNDPLYLPASLEEKN